MTSDSAMLTASGGMTIDEPRSQRQPRWQGSTILTTKARAISRPCSARRAVNRLEGEGGDASIATCEPSRSRGMVPAEKRGIGHSGAIGDRTFAPAESGLRA